MFIARILFSAILMIGALLHGYGSFLAFPDRGPALVWSLGSSAFAIFLAAICVLCAYRTTDRALAAVCLAGCLAWVAVVIAFGLSIGNVVDPRVLYHAVTGLVLAGLALSSIVASGRVAK
ncbi:hypothetical protein [Rhizobium sp. C4]|uniref:hypothetical protein n=1 Tax=Rhizobium sp. C4 TaxID=1349800 RepID=UPI001E4EF26A|nr:hypothetical protein [Rhizobium sp. C4]MCD2171698.1 hypothetical protein [Rhizobium sp. C4]